MYTLLRVWLVPESRPALCSLSTSVIVSSAIDLLFTLLLVYKSSRWSWFSKARVV
jgi:hypothetical protein